MNDRDKRMSDALDWLLEYTKYKDAGYSEEEICESMNLTKKKLRAKYSCLKAELRVLTRPRIIFSMPMNIDVDKLYGA